MRVAYADPPYLGQSSRKYRKHPDYSGEVDHTALIAELQSFDGWALSASSPSLRTLLPMCPKTTRVAAWVKPFAWVHPTIRVTYAWEPILFVPARPVKQEDDREFHASGYKQVRDWVSCSPQMNSQLPGQKPDMFCAWLFELLGCRPDDEFVDLYRGSGAVSASWSAWSNQARLAV